MPVMPVGIDVVLEIRAGLEAWRLANGYSQRAAAELIGISQPHYARIEREGRRVSLAVAKRIRDLAGVSLPTPLGTYQAPMVNPHE